MYEYYTTQGKPMSVSHKVRLQVYEYYTTQGKPMSVSQGKAPSVWILHHTR